MKLVINTDGGTRPTNPGNSSYAFVATFENGQQLVRGGKIGFTTNNVAEYTALINALSYAYVEEADEVEILSDSKLMVEQMKGKWAVKDRNILRLWAEASSLAERFDKFTISHVRREFNTEADAEATRWLTEEK